MNSVLLGRWGESEAASYMTKKGYTLVAANYRSRFGEIDLILEKGDIIVFAEVKLRNSDAMASPAEYVDRRKIEKIVTTAGLWILENNETRQPRFDVIEVRPTDGFKEGTAKINHIINAFEQRDMER